jgi:pimeloyl-ACP methyl ester carboxylesterase
VIAGAGHLPFLERPEQVVPMVSAHFASSAAR